jgi:hypothetical protein
MEFTLLRIEYFILIFLYLVQYQNYIDPNTEETSPNPSRHVKVQILTELFNSQYLEQQ